MTKEQTELVINNLGLVHHCIKKYIHLYPNHQDYDDYYQEGCVGLVEASIRFDLSKGFKFASFASSYIYGYLLDYKNKKLPLIKYPRSRIDNRAKISLYLINNPDATHDDIMKDLNISQSKYLEAIQDVEYYEDFTYTNKDGEELNVLDVISDPNELSLADQIDLSELYNDIDSILDKLKFSNPKAKQIFIEYIYDLIYIEDHRDRNTQQYYADKYRCSRSSIVRILKHGMNLLKEELERYGYTL